ncbi:hypothetical protein BDZ90DRAFT_229667 [Jaminaea rosea]|uniref:Uncharacterized protein n=1 Tax=Jaminaea rosea TaxID=1569628 RepID=A0A316V5G3_9BASI|nr:hypothetical protein BDZ90DRAFT_229667 [Jaminaea rosea]PWN30655.1 hypothetical protein BDZ90DRAFT_229667 [Jaminaea rosea]
MSDKSAPPAARCPLGFTGTPPVGHPVMPGMAAAGTDSSSSVKSAKASSASSLSLLLHPSQWSPTTLLIVDGVFLVLCILVALYLPQIRAALSGSGKGGTLGGGGASVPRVGVDAKGRAGETAVVGGK